MEWRTGGRLAGFCRPAHKREPVPQCHCHRPRRRGRGVAALADCGLHICCGDARSAPVARYDGPCGSLGVRAPAGLRRPPLPPLLPHPHLQPPANAQDNYAALAACYQCRLQSHSADDWGSRPAKGAFARGRLDELRGWCGALGATPAEVTLYDWTGAAIAPVNINNWDLTSTVSSTWAWVTASVPHPPPVAAANGAPPRVSGSFGFGFGFGAGGSAWWSGAGANAALAIAAALALVL